MRRARVDEDSQGAGRSRLEPGGQERADEPGKHVTPGEWRDKAWGEKLVAEGLETFAKHPEEKAEPFRG